MPRPLQRVIFTCGGTAGHVNPAIALAQLALEKEPQAQILFVGAERGLEKDLVPKAGYAFKTVHISSFHRSFKPAEIRHNLISVGNLIRAPGEARAILRAFRPDAVVGTGGYASFPLVKAAAKMGIPTAVHESNAVPGLTTQMLETYADRIMVGFESCRRHYRRPEKVVVTGTPVRNDFFSMTKAQAKKTLGVDDGRPLVVSFWGSLGAAGMNRRMADFLALEAAKQPFHHIHGAGKQGCPMILEALGEKGVNRGCGRARAPPNSELTALGTPALMVPSPYVTNNHQEKNARALEEAGGAAVLTEAECSGQTLFQTACAILHDGARLREMEAAMASLGIRDAAERIYRTVLEIRK